MKSCEHICDVDRLGLGPAEFGIEAGRIRNISNQAIQALNVFLDNRHQFLLLVRIADSGGGLNGTAQRSQWIFYFVADVGGKSFDRVHPFVQGAGHFSQHAGELADLIATPGKVRDLV